MNEVHSHRRENRRNTGFSPQERPACAWCPRKREDWIGWRELSRTSWRNPMGEGGGEVSLSPPPAQLGNISSSHYQGLTTNESPLVFPIWCIFSFSNSGVHQLLRPECCSLRRLHVGPRVGLCGFLKRNHLAPLTCLSWPSLGAPKVWRPRSAPKPSIFHSRN